MIAKKNVRIILGVLAMLSTASVSFGQDLMATVTGVTGGIVRIRKEANKDSLVLATVSKGDKVVIVDDSFDWTSRGWVKIKTASKVTGYMFSTFLSLKTNKYATPVADGQIPTEASRAQYTLALSEVKSLESNGQSNTKPIGSGLRNVEIGGVAPEAKSQKIVDIPDKYSVEEKIKGDINKLTETLAKGGKEPDIRSLVVLYNPQNVDFDKTELRNEVKLLKTVVAEREQEVGRSGQVIKTLKAMLSEKELLLIGQAKLEGELVALRDELNRKSKEISIGGSKDIDEVKKAIANIQQQITVMMKPLVMEKVAATEKATSEKSLLEEISNLKKVVSVLTKMPDFKLISLVETEGEEVFLKGVGAVKMTSEGNMSIFKVPKGASKNGYRTFAHLLKRMVEGENGVTYFICDKEMVQGTDTDSLGVRKKG